MKNNTNILVVRYGTVGDTVLASAVFRELRNTFPNAQIDALVDNIAGGVLANCPYIDNLQKIQGKYKNILSYFKLFRKYTTVYFLKSDSFFSKVAFLSGVKNRIGFTRTEYDVSKNHFLTKVIPSNENRHVADCFLDMLQLTDIDIQNRDTEAWTNKADDDTIENFLNSFKEKTVLIQAYSRIKEKNWLDEYWVQVIEYLSNELGAVVFLSGGAKDYTKYEELTQKLNNCAIKPINISGKFSISQTTSLIKKVDMIIGIDSGLIHIAAAFKKDSILLNGNTSLKRWQPRNENCKIVTKNFPCSPCCINMYAPKLCKNKIAECMKALVPQMVIEQINSISEKQKFTKV